MAVTTLSNQLGTVSAIRGEMFDSFASYKRGRDQLEQVLGTAMHWNLAKVAYKLAGLYMRQLANEAEAQKAKKGHARAGGAAGERRRRTEQEEDAELLEDEKKGNKG